MSVTGELDLMIEDLKKRGLTPEHIIMGRQFFYRWMLEISRGHNISLESGKKKYNFSHKNISIIICDSEILEVLPNAKFMLEPD